MHWSSRHLEWPRTGRYGDLIIAISYEPKNAIRAITKGNRLLLTVILEDPWGLKEPLEMKKVWRWAPEEAIFPYVDCEPPADPSILVTQP